jgi:hypothetical protein
VDVLRPEAKEPPITGADQAGPRIEHSSVAIDRDDSNLQDAMLAG